VYESATGGGSGYDESWLVLEALQGWRSWFLTGCKVTVSWCGSKEQMVSSVRPLVVRVSLSLSADA